MITNEIKGIGIHLYRFCTAFPHILWKKTGVFVITTSSMLLLCLLLLASCSSLKKLTGKEPPILENSLISMGEEEIRKKMGEPSSVSMMNEKHILWTYRPEMKIMPDNKDTVYVEFEDGKVIKVTKAKK